MDVNTSKALRDDTYCHECGYCIDTNIPEPRRVTIFDDRVCIKYNKSLAIGGPLEPPGSIYVVRSVECVIDNNPAINLFNFKRWAYHDSNI